MMKKIISAITLTLIIVFIITGCFDESESMKLAVCGSYAVPGMFCYELKGDTFSCNVSERDKEGRILFIYETKSAISNNVESAYVICQKIDSQYVYFYEDICYQLSTNEKFDIETLKELNDWDKSLDESKMSKRKHDISMDLFIMTESQLDHNKVVLLCCRAFDVDDSQIEFLTVLDVNQSGQAIYLLSIEQDDITEKHFVLADTNYEISFVEVDADSIDQLSVLKKENGWIYE